MDKEDEGNDFSLFMRGKFCAPSAFPKTHFREKMTFGFFWILTQTLTHTGIRLFGTNGENRARERGFPQPEGLETSQNASSLHENRSS